LSFLTLRVTDELNVHIIVRVTLNLLWLVLIINEYLDFDKRVNEWTLKSNYQPKDEKGQK